MYLAEKIKAIISIIMAVFAGICVVVFTALVVWVVFIFAQNGLEAHSNTSVVTGQIAKTEMVDAYDSDAEYKITVKQKKGNSINFELNPTVNNYVKKGDTVKVIRDGYNNAKSIEKLNN